MSSLCYQTIAAAIPETAGKLYIGYSGGIDSQVLLHLCASQPHLRERIIAVHIHHGLQTAADAWEAHCRQQAENFGIAFLSFKVNAKAATGESPEAAAREARYRVFKDLLQADDCLLLAQHREDQLETVLLQLFRGAGVNGLAAMPEIAPLGLGHMLRPLLNTAKSEINNYAVRQQLQWVEDPSNHSSDYDRNFLRNDILPLLKQRWPALDKTVARSARHCGEAATLLDDWGKQTLAQLLNPTDNSLDLANWSKFDRPQQNLLLRGWFRQLGLKPPSSAQLHRMHRQLIAAGEHAVPELSNQDRLFKKYRQRLYCLDPRHLGQADACSWPSDSDSLVLSNAYRLSRIPADSGIAQSLWQNSEVTVRPRSGGEKLKLTGRNGQHCLKKLFQEAGIPPWERECRPLIYLDGRLAAIAGLWVAEWASAPAPCYRLTWLLPLPEKEAN